MRCNTRFLFRILLVLALLPALALPATAQGEDEEVDELDEQLAELVEQARTDLAAKLEIDAGDVEVVSARRVTWRDSSCGCSKEGEMYMQMLTEGALILLQADGKEYRYHSSRTGPPFHCEKPKKNDPLPDDSAD